jgi:hypothetical protein
MRSLIPARAGGAGARPTRRALACIALAAATASSHAADGGVLGRWTIERAEPAPWNAPGVRPDDSIASAYVGKSVTFAEKRIDGPALLACTDPELRFVPVPAEGLFQGGLAGIDVDAPKARATATRMGFAAQPVRTVVTKCEHDIAFHLSDEDHAAFALDNWIFWMKRELP